MASLKRLWQEGFDGSRHCRVKHQQVTMNHSIAQAEAGTFSSNGCFIDKLERCHFNNSKLQRRTTVEGSRFASMATAESGLNREGENEKSNDNSADRRDRFYWRGSAAFPGKRRAQCPRAGPPEQRPAQFVGY